MANKTQLTPRLNRLEPNIVIDGGMEIWPEGTSRSVGNNVGLYGAVLWNCLNNNTGITLTNSQQSSVPSATNLSYSNQVSKTAAGTLAATTRVRLFYGIEGYDVSRLINDEFSVIFWVKSSVASNRSVSISNNSGSHSYVQQYTISSANTWQLVSLKFPALSTCPGTIDKTTNIGLSLRFGIVLGSTYQTSTLSAWGAGDFYAGTGEDTTWLTGTTHDFNITGVMVIPGDWRSLSSNTSSYRFLRSGRNFQEELAKSQRYFEKSYDIETAPGTTGNPQGHHEWTGTGSSNRPFTTLYYKTTKRTSPSVTFYNGNTGSTATPIWDFQNSVSFGIASNSGNTNCQRLTPSGTPAANSQLAVHWAADSRF